MKTRLLLGLGQHGAKQNVYFWYKPLGEIPSPVLRIAGTECPLS